MKKMLLLIFMLFFGLSLFGCNAKNKSVKVNFIINGENHPVLLKTGEAINKELVPVDQEKNGVKLYFDEEFSKEYNNQKITQDLTIYVITDEKKKYNTNMNIKFVIGYHRIKHPWHYYCDYYYGNEVKNIDNSGVRYKIFMINSKLEIENFIIEKEKHLKKRVYSIEVENLDKDGFNASIMDNYLLKYDANFFKEKSLVILDYSIPTTPSEVTVTGIAKDNGKLLITTNVKLGIFDAISFGITVLEISKEDCKNIDSLEICK